MGRKSWLVAIGVFVAVGALPLPGLARGSSGGPPVRSISFLPPLDFKTGAVPPSAAFNAAAGDHLPQIVLRTPSNDWVAVGDLNHDGKPDVVQTNVIAGSISIFIGDGRGSFQEPRTYAVGVHPGFVEIGDLDLDGKPDLAVANWGSGNVAVLRGAGDGSFQPASFVAVPAPRNVAIGRFNADDLPDLAVASGNPGVGVAILTGNQGAPGTFALTQAIRVSYDGRPANPSYVTAGDFDRSGFSDLAVSVGTSTSAGDAQPGDPRPTGDDALIFLNRSSPAGSAPAEPFNAAPHQPAIRVGATAGPITVTDLNRDGNSDLAVVGASSFDVTTILGDRRGYFVAKARNVSLGGISRSVAAGDFDGDGIPDLATANFASSTVSVLRGNGDGSVQPAVDFWVGDAPTGVAVGNFNGDRRLDVVSGRLRDDHLALLINDSPKRGDGVAITRDIPFGSPTHLVDDPFAAHHTLDVYSPPKGTASLAGRGRPYPVVFFVHGGQGTSADKSHYNFVLRTLAREGIVAVSTNYRLGLGMADVQTQDVIQALRWTVANIATYGGEPRNIFMFGNSHGAVPTARIATRPEFAADRQHMRAMVMAGFLGPELPSATQPPSLLLNGTEGLEIPVRMSSVAFSAGSVAIGAESEQHTIDGRDHFTLVSRMALADDPARALMLDFLKTRLAG